MPDTTQELARWFCDLTQLDYREAEGVVYLRKRENEWTIPLDGWAGVGIVVDEMRRQGWSDGHDEWRWWFRKGHLFGRAVDGDDLERCLSAACFALTFEANIAARKSATDIPTNQKAWPTV